MEKIDIKRLEELWGKRGNVPNTFFELAEKINAIIDYITPKPKHTHTFKEENDNKCTGCGKVCRIY